MTQIFGSEAIQFQLIPERVNRFLARPDPIVLHYTLDPNLPPPEKPVAYDVEVRVEDASLKSKMTHVILNMAPETAKELSKLDEEVRRTLV